MVALRSLNTDEREDMLAELAETRRERSRILGALKRHPDSEKLRWHLDAYDRCVSRYERDLGLVAFAAFCSVWVLLGMIGRTVRA